MIQHRRHLKYQSLEHELTLFINHERALKDIQRSLNRNISCAIIGGKWMGKTRLFLHLRELFSQKPSTKAQKLYSTTFIPIYFSPRTFSISSLKDLYSQLINDTIEEMYEWLRKCAYDRSTTIVDEIKIDSRIQVASVNSVHAIVVAFEADLWEIVKTVRHVVKEPKLVFMFDNLYKLNNQDIAQSFVAHWFELLNKDTQRTKNLRPYIVSTIACLRDHIDQFSGSLDKQTNMSHFPGHDEIRPIYLGVFGRTDVAQMLEVELGKDIVDALPESLIDELYNLSGGHPQLSKTMVDHIVYDIKQFEAQIDINYFEDLKVGWHALFSDTFRWIGERIIEDRMARPMFELLVNSKRIWQRHELFQEIQKTPNGSRYSNELSKALLLLQCWGVVRQVLPDSYQVSGQMCYEHLMIHQETIVREAHMSTIESYQELEKQILSVLKITDEIKFIELYEGDIDKIRAMLRQHLESVRTDIRQLADIESKSTFLNPITEDMRRQVIRDAERIGLSFELDITPKLEIVAREMVQEAQATQVAEEEKNSILQDALAHFNRALDIFGQPVVKAAALATALQTMITFFQTLGK